MSIKKIWIFTIVCLLLASACYILGIPDKKPSQSQLSVSSESRYPIFKTEKNSNVLSQHEGTGDIEYGNYNLSSHNNLKSTLEAVNNTRIEFPKRAIEISMIQQFLDSGDLKMAYFSANRLKEKQENLSKLTQH